MSGNFPTGFYGFQARIEALTDALGGTHDMRVLVEIDFSTQLREHTLWRHRLTTKNYDSGEIDRMWSIWTAANDADFDEVASKVEQQHRVRGDREELFRTPCPMLKCDLVIRRSISLDVLYLETDAASMTLAISGRDDYASSRTDRIGKPLGKDVWHAHLTEDGGERLANRWNRRPAQASQHCTSGRAAAVKVLKRWAETIFAPEFTEHERRRYA